MDRGIPSLSSPRKCRRHHLQYIGTEGAKGGFRGRKFADADPPDFLDREGAEFLLIAASDDIGGELGIELAMEEEDERSADIFRDLRLDREKRPTAPLFTGEWE